MDNVQILAGDNRNSPFGTPLQFGAPVTRIDNEEKQYACVPGTNIPLLNTPNPIFNGMRINSRMPVEVWKEMDDVIVKAKTAPRAGINAARAAGLVRPIDPTKLVKTYTKQSRVGKPTISLQGRTNPNRDEVDFKEGGTVLPVIMSEYVRGWRESSQFDRDNFEAHVNSVLNAAEQGFHLGFDGIKKGEFVSKGILNTPDSVTIAATGDFGTISNVVPSGRALVAKHAELGNYNGIHLFVHTDQHLEMSTSYYDNTSDTPLKRLLDMEQIEAVHLVPAEYATAGTISSVRMSGDAFNLIEGMDVQVREWMSPDGMTVHIVVIAIIAPLIKTTHEGDHNVVNMTGV